MTGFYTKTQVCFLLLVTYVTQQWIEYIVVFPCQYFKYLFILFTATYVRQQYSTCISMVMMVTQVHHNVTLHVYCLSCQFACWRISLCNTNA